MRRFFKILTTSRNGSHIFPLDFLTRMFKNFDRTLKIIIFILFLWVKISMIYFYSQKKKFENNNFKYAIKIFKSAWKNSNDYCSCLGTTNKYFFSEEVDFYFSWPVCIKKQNHVLEVTNASFFRRVSTFFPNILITYKS